MTTTGMCGHSNEQDGSDANELLASSEDLVTRLRSVGGYFDAAALEHVSLSECADEIERLRNALAVFTCHI